jgi:hypothetical protein
VLARLLELNKRRAEPETLAGIAAGGKAKKQGRRKRATEDESKELF